jgi:PncC family amidohydrolase
MKTFFNLIQEVQERGLCHHCGGCVTFCTAVNYGALELDPDGRPQYRDRDKCIDCGLCYMICPEIHELDEEQKRMVSWSAPMGRVMDAGIARARDPAVRERGTDGGVVTALLLHLFDMGFITYSNAAKTELIGVPQSLLAQHGAVSAQVAAAMATGARLRAGSSLAVSVTGVAGPGGGTATKPVGLVFLGLASVGAEPTTQELLLGGIGRTSIRLKTTEAALELAIRACHERL